VQVSDAITGNAWGKIPAISAVGGTRVPRPCYTRARIAFVDDTRSGRIAKRFDAVSVGTRLARDATWKMRRAAGGVSMVVRVAAGGIGPLAAAW
jgi:hypothetical protein